MPTEKSKPGKAGDKKSSSTTKKTEKKPKSKD